MAISILSKLYTFMLGGSHTNGSKCFDDEKPQFKTETRKSFVINYEFGLSWMWNCHFVRISKLIGCWCFINDLNEFFPRNFT